MQSEVGIDPAAARILVFEEVYPLRAAHEQAEKNKLNAFGTLARLNPFNRPRADTVTLAKWELRYEPFWHVAARREVDYVHEATYALPVGNTHAQRVRIAGQDFPVLGAERKAHAELPVQEACHRRIDAVLFHDGMKREIKPALLQRYVDKYKTVEHAALDNAGAVEPLLSSHAAMQLALSRLSAEAIDANRIDADAVTLDKLHLYYRPVFAFEYAWAPSGRTGVVEVDGLTGDVVEAGQWFRDKIDGILTRDVLVDLGADVVSMAVSGGSIAVKLMNKLV